MLFDKVSEYDLLWENKKIINIMMVKDFLIISFTGKDDKIGLKVNNNFYIHDFQNKTQNNEILVSKILNISNKHKVNFDKKFSIIVNNGPGSFSSIRVALAVAKGITIAKSVQLFGFNDADLPQFNLENIEVLIDKNLIAKKLIKPLYLS